MNEGHEKRLWRIFQAWKGADEHCTEQAWRDNSALLGAPCIALLMGLAAVPVLGALDSALWSDVARTGGEQVTSFLSETFVGWTLISGCLLQGLLIERFLARQTREERSMRGWLRFARLLVAAIPLFGLYAIPGWRWLLNHRPGWAFQTEPPGNGSRDALSWHSLRSAWPIRFEGTSRWLASHRALVSLYLFEMFVLLLVALWLTADGSAGKRTFAWAFSILFHLAASLGMGVFFAGQARRANFSQTGMLGLCLLSLVWLPPVPLLPLLGFLPYLFIDVEGLERTLAHQVHASHAATDNPLRWRGLKGELQVHWERTPRWRRVLGPPRELIRGPVDSGQVDTHLTDFYRLRSLSLPFEAAWLTWVSLRLAGHHPRMLVGLCTVLDSLYLSALILGLVGLLFVGARFFRRLLRATAAPTPRDRHSYARAFAFTQLGFAAGLWLGEALYTHDAPEIATVAGATGLLGMLVLFGPLLLEIQRPVPDLFRRDMRQLVPWLLLCPLLLAASLRFSRTSTADLERDWRVLQALTEIAPLLGVFPGIAHLDWLLRPYPAKKMFLLELPLRVRAILAFLTFTGLLPLGGLAVPAWIAIRRRGWPVYVAFNGNENI